MKKIVFDLDNTLLFISKNWTINYKKIIDKYKLNTTPEDLYACIGTFERNMADVVVTNEIFLKHINKYLFINLGKDVLDELLNYYADIPLLNTEVIYDTLSYLSKKYDLIAYTNWFTDNQIKRLKKYNLDQFFSKIYGWDKLPIKPSKRGLISIIKDDNPANYIFIGDSIEHDLELPNSIGADTIFYNIKNIKQNKYEEVLNINGLKKIL